jgi:transcriptional regulator with XRE-family HTH domain
MIKNTKQAAAARKRLGELEAQLAKLRANNSSAPYAEVVMDTILGFINELKFELAEFDSLKENDECNIRGGELFELPRMLIQARLARGLTQKELADKLEIDEQQIQRYEISDYESASWSRLLEVAIALEFEVTLDDEFIYNLDRIYLAPAGLSEDSITESCDRIHLHKSLFFAP